MNSGSRHIRISRAALESIRLRAAEMYPEECCGVLVGRAVDGVAVTEAVHVVNTHADNRARRYAIDARSLFSISRDAERRSLDVVGFYHSHPDHPARPSETDLREATFPHYVYMIQAVEGGTPTELTAWTLADDRSAFRALHFEPAD